MNTVLQDLSPSTVVQAMHRNLTTFWLQLFGCHPGTTFREGPGFCWLETGIRHDTFNRGLQTLLEPTIPDPNIEKIVRHCQEGRLPFLWFLGAPSDIANGSSVIEGYGLTHHETEPIMALDLLNFHEDLPVAPQLVIQPVTTEELLKQWIDICEFGSPEDAVQLWFTSYASLCLKQESPLHLYLGTVDGKPVATSEVFFGGGVALVGAINTLKGHRQQRFGTAMTLKALQTAREQGYRISVLSASPMGINIYRRLGFQEYGTFSVYLWHPK